MALEDSISVARLKDVGVALAIIALYALLLAPGLILTAYIGGWGVLLVGITAALLYPATGLLADGVVHRRREKAAKEVAWAAHHLQDGREADRLWLRESEERQAKQEEARKLREEIAKAESQRTGRAENRRRLEEIEARIEALERLDNQIQHQRQTWRDINNEAEDMGGAGRSY